LKVLNFGENSLREIPAEVNLLTNLEELYLQNNHLTELSLSLQGE